MRELATVQIVKEIENIPGKDKIGLVCFRKVSWKVIGPKTTPVGSKVIYVEYDAVLPPAPAFAFLKTRCWSEKYQGYLIKAMRMGGVVSYGIMFTFKDLEGLLGEKGVSANPDDYAEGFDLTGILGVIKKEDEEITREKPPKTAWARFLLKIRRIFGKPEALPESYVSFISPTDETRIENLSYLLDGSYLGKKIYTTVKIDGQSATFARWKGNFYITSRNRILAIMPIARACRVFRPAKRTRQDTVFFEMACKYDLARKLAGLSFDCAIQCEQAGPSIQKNRLRLTDIALYLFNVKNLDTDKYLGWDNLVETAAVLNIPTVPLIERATFRWRTIEEMYAYAKGEYHEGQAREGVVIRADEPVLPSAELNMHQVWSYKIINPDYLC
jgi:hypothetical protein